MKRLVFVLALVALVAAGVPDALAQINTGSLYGKVTDPSGAVMPGATVTLKGANIRPTSTTTGAQGEYRFASLDNGVYTLGVNLTGFSSVQRQVTVSTGVNTEVNFSIKVAAVEETITVTAETPVIDTKKLGTGTTVTSDELSKIPTSRDPWAFLRTVPGVQIDRLNQAGTESGQQSGYIGKGSPQTDSMWVLDGVVITDPGAVGASPTYFDYAAFDEVAITTGGADVRVATGGVGINMVTKRGTNAFHGGFDGYFTNHDLQSSNLPDSLVGDPRLKGSDKADHADQIGMYSLDVGGPIIKDRLWFWGSYGHQDLRIVKFNQTKDKTVLNDYNAKMNLQVSPANMFSVFWFNGVKEKFGRANALGLGTETQSHTRDQGNAYENGSNWPHGFLKVEDNHVFSPNFNMNVKLAHYNAGFSLTPEGGMGCDESYNSVTSVASGCSNQYKSTRPQSTANIDTSYFKGNNEFKFGFAYRKASVDSTTALPGSGVQARTETRRGTVARVQRESVKGYEGSYNSLYAQDTYTSGRLTLQGGLRWDLQKANNVATTASANPMFPDLLPDLVYNGAGPTISWSNISPRAGLTYAFDETRRTIVRANFSIFTEQLAMPDVTAVNPVGGVGFLEYAWNDANHDGIVQKNEVNTAGGLVGTPRNFTLSTANTIDPNYKAPRDLEVLGGIEHQLIPDLAVGLTYTYRHSTDLPYAPYTGVNGTDWVACDPVSSNGYTASCQDLGPQNTAALNANNAGLTLTNRPDYSRTYSGIEVTATKRLSHRWMGRLGFGYNNWTESFNGRNGIQDPNPTLYDTYGYSPFGSTILNDPKKSGGQVGYFSAGSGTVYWLPSKWQLSANALYQLGAGFEIAGNLYARQGYIRPINLTVSNTFNDTVLAVDNGSQRLPDVWNLDMRLAWDHKLSGGLRLALMADLFNTFNSGTTLRQVDAADSANFNQISQIMNPRLLRFGVRLTF